MRLASVPACARLLDNDARIAQGQMTQGAEPLRMRRVGGQRLSGRGEKLKGYLRIGWGLAVGVFFAAVFAAGAFADTGPNGAIKACVKNDTGSVRFIDGPGF